MAVVPTEAISPSVLSAVQARRAVKLKVFVSYSREDVGFADQLASGLRLCGFEPFVDRHSVASGEAWQQRLGQLIRDADTVVFVLSPASASSPVCAWEVAEAQRLNKRILPVLCRPLDGALPPQPLSDLSYIFFYAEPSVPGAGFGQGLTELVAALNSNLEWLREHTRLLQRAEEWAAAGRSPNRMLSGADIEAAKAWAAARPADAPPPTELHLEYLRASEADEIARSNAERQKLQAIAAAQADRARALEVAEEATRKRARLRIGAFVALTLAATFAGWQWRRAIEANSVVLKERDQAEAARGAAEVARKEATASRDLAEQERSKAVDLRTRQLLVASAQRVAAGDGVAGVTLALEALPRAGVAKGNIEVPPGVEQALDSALRGLHESVVLHGHDGPVRNATFAVGGKYILTTGDDGTVRLFDAETGRLIKLFSEPKTEFRSAWITDDGRYVGASDSGGKIGVVWSVETGVKIREFGRSNPASLVRAVRGAHRVLVATAGGGTDSIDIATGALIALGGSGHVSDDASSIFNMKTKEQHPTSAISPDGRFILLNPECRLIESASGRFISRLGESAACGRVAFTQDGSFILVENSEDNGSVKIVSTETGTSIGSIAGKSLSSLVLNEKGRLLASTSLSQDGAIEQVLQFFDVAQTNQPISTFRNVSGGNRDGVTPFNFPYGDGNAPRFSPDGSVALIIPHQGPSVVWSVRDGVTIAQIHARDGVFSPSGSLLASNLGEDVAIYRVLDGKLIARLAGHRHNVNSIQFSEDETALLTSSSDGTARLWRIEPHLSPSNINRDPIVLRASQDSMRRQLQDLQFSCDGERLLFSHNYGASTVYDTKLRKSMALVEHGAQTNSAYFLDCERYVVPVSADGTEQLRLFSTRTGDDLGSFALPLQPGVKRGWEDRIATFGSNGWRVTPDRKYLLGFERKTGAIHIWSTQDRRHLITLNALGLGKDPWLRISPNSTLAIAGGEGGRVVAFETPSGRMIREWQDWESWKGGFVWSRDGSRIARNDGVWRVEDWMRVVDFHIDSGCGVVRAWSSDAEQVAFHRRDTSNVCLYSSKNGRLTWSIDHRYWEAHSREVTWLSFAAGGQRLITVSSDDTARLWDTTTGERIAVIGKPFRKYDQKIVIRSDGLQIDIANKGRTAVTGHMDVIRVWDVDTGAIRTEFRHGLGYLNSLAVSDDGRRISASDQDGGIMLWERITDASALVDRAMLVLPRCLNQEERAEVGLDNSTPDWCLRHRKWPYGHRRVGVEFQMKPSEPGYEPSARPAPERGVKIVSVLRHLPGEQAGLMSGDVILEINGRRVDTVGDATTVIGDLAPGSDNEFIVLRDGVELKLRVRPQN